MKAKFITLLLLLGSISGYTQTISEVFFPQYIQGAGTFDPADNRKVPFVCRMKLSGLQPNTVYRYFNRFVTDTTSTNTGDGNFILVKDSGNFIRVTDANLADPGPYGSFTTDASGSFTGWFANEADEIATFSPGTPIFFRVYLNNGAGGGAIARILTAANPVTVINFSNEADAFSGTALRCTPLDHASPKQFILLYGNLSFSDIVKILFGVPASVRPVSGTFIESDGTANTIANGYASFYSDSVNGVNKAWGAIIPNSLPGGIRLITRHSLSNGQLLLPYLSFDGKWPSVNHTTINTENPTGGLTGVLVIDGSRLSIINFWLNGEKTDDDQLTLQWNTPGEANAVEYMIERSVDGGKTFTEVRKVRTSGLKELYELQDKRSESAVQYRVTMLDKTGSKTFSDVLTVDGVIKLNLLRNPVKDQLVVRHPQAEAGTSLQVVSIDGRQLIRQNVQLGSVQTTVDVNRLVPGNYLVVFNINGRRQSKSFIKQ